MPATCVEQAGVMAVAPGQMSLMESITTATAESLVIVTRKATAAPAVPGSSSPKVPSPLASLTLTTVRASGGGRGGVVPPSAPAGGVFGGGPRLFATPGGVLRRGRS